VQHELRRRVRHGLGLIQATQGKERATVAFYLVWDFLNQAFKIPFRSHELTLTLQPGVNVSVHTFASQLGAYLDVFHERVYGQLPDFIARPGQVIVDAGAHVGFYTLWQAPSVGPTGRVYAFEPNPATYPLLVKNVKQNGLGWVECVPRALAAEEGTLSMQASPRGSSSARVLYPAAGEATSAVPVPSTTLDAFVSARGVSRIDILKMDVEGAEIDIVRGGCQHALPITRRVVMESHKTRSAGLPPRTREAVRDLLAPLGFRLVYDHQGKKIVYFERSTGLPD
jgi:FkbM family methyltransferase